MVPGRRLWCVVILMFAVGVICSVVCPERADASAADHSEDGYCSECISTDFVGASKFCEQGISRGATTAIQIELLVPSWTWFPAETSASAAIIVIPAQSIFPLHLALRI